MFPSGTTADPIKRPLAVTVVACVYLAVGAIGAIAHFHDLQTSPGDAILAELTEALAILSGVFLLQGQNWARWLAVAWIAFHVVLSAFGRWQELAIHAVFCAVIAWFLFGPGAAAYFHRTRVEPT